MLPSSGSTHFTDRSGADRPARRAARAASCRGGRGRTRGASRGPRPPAGRSPARRARAPDRWTPRRAPGDRRGPARVERPVVAEPRADVGEVRAGDHHHAPSPRLHQRGERGEEALRLGIAGRIAPRGLRGAEPAEHGHDARLVGAVAERVPQEDRLELELSARPCAGTRLPAQVEAAGGRELAQGVGVGREGSRAASRRPWGTRRRGGRIGACEVRPEQHEGVDARVEPLGEGAVGVAVARGGAPQVHVRRAEADDGPVRGAAGRGAGEALLLDEAGELVGVVVVGAAGVGGGAHVGGGEGADDLAAAGAVAGRVEEQGRVELGRELLDEGGVHGAAEEARAALSAIWAGVRSARRSGPRRRRGGRGP